MKDWRVSVQGDCCAEVIEFDGYREALEYCREHRTSDDPLHLVELMDFAGRLVWASSTQDGMAWDEVLGLCEEPQGFYRYSEHTGWSPSKGGAGVQPQ